MNLPGIEMRLTGWCLPVSSFLPFLRIGTIFPVFQSHGPSPDCHDFSIIMEIICEFNKSILPGKTFQQSKLNSKFSWLVSTQSYVSKMQVFI